MNGKGLPSHRNLDILHYTILINILFSFFLLFFQPYYKEQPLMWAKFACKALQRVCICAWTRVEICTVR